MASDWPPVSIVIPNYNGNKLLAKNLPDVRTTADTYPGEVTIIVVDDGSTETGTGEIVQQFAGTRYIRHKTNQGFSSAVLTGVKNAPSELVFLLNSDVSPSPGALAPLVAVLRDDQVFAASPLIFNEDGSANMHCWNMYYWRGSKLMRKKWSLSQLSLNGDTVPARHLYCSGGSMLLSRAKFLQLGGFAKLYRPYYCEDLDLGARAWRKGWQSVFEPRSSVVHQEVGAIRAHKNPNEVRVIRRRNKLFFEWSQYSIFRLLCRRSLYWLGKIFASVVRGDRVYLEGFWLAIKGINQAVAHRREIRHSSPQLTFEQLIPMLEDYQLNDAPSPEKYRK